VNSVYLNQWSIKEIESDGSHHFIGFDLNSRQIVVSPCIISFLKSTRTGITRNEKQYFLVGEPGSSTSIEKVWETWCKERSIPELEWVDITKEYVGTE